MLVLVLLLLIITFIKRQVGVKVYACRGTEREEGTRWRVSAKWMWYFSQHSTVLRVVKVWGFHHKPECLGWIRPKHSCYSIYCIKHLNPTLTSNTETLCICTTLYVQSVITNKGSENKTSAELKTPFRFFLTVTAVSLQATVARFTVRQTTTLTQETLGEILWGKVCLPLSRKTPHTVR